MGEQLDTPESHNPMTMQDVRAWLRWMAPSIRRLVSMGEKQAMQVEFAYRAWYANQSDPKLEHELLTVVKDYIVRDHTLTEIDDLQRRFGHRVDGESK